MIIQKFFSKIAMALYIIGNKSATVYKFKSVLFHMFIIFGFLLLYDIVF